MKRIALFLIALCPLAALAQSPKALTEPTAKLVRLHYVKPEDIYQLLLGTVSVRGDKALNAVVINGNPDAVARAEQMIQQLDVPQARSAERNVELTVYVIGATDKATEAPAVPQNLQSVVRQLKAIFPYSTYSLLNSMLLRSREGIPVSTTGILRSFPSPPPAGSGFASIYNILYHLLPRAPSNPSGTIHFSQFEFNVMEPLVSGTGGTTSIQRATVDIKTNLDLPENQKVVIGKTDIDGGDAALFVVLSAKIE